jgi:hypothetical protein
MKRNGLNRYVVLMGIALWAIMMAGCEQKSINQIKAEPTRYANHEVLVVGTVTRSASILGTGAYEVEDGTGKLWIVSKTGVPREGARVVVKGTIRDGFNLSAIVKLPEVISSGLVMIEHSHKARN